MANARPSRSESSRRATRGRAFSTATPRRTPTSCASSRTASATRSKRPSSRRLRPEQGDARRMARGTASQIRDARPPRRPLAGNRRDDFEVGESPRGGGAASEYERGAKTVEVDAFQYESAHLGKNEMERSRACVYKDWLRKRIESRGGAELEDASLQSFRRTRAVRRLRGPASEGPAALMRGTLVVGDDPAKFAELLRCGVGRHRAYGFGMLLVRPPKPAGAG